MKHFLWQFQNLNVPMMEDDNGTLYTTTRILAATLGVVENNLRNIYHLHREEFDGLTANTVGANDFLQQNKDLFGVQRVRADMHLWSEDDMILFAGISRTETGKAFRKEMVKAIKQQARKTCVTQEQYQAMATELAVISARLAAMEDARPGFDKAASAAGAALQAQRYTKVARS